MLDKAQPSWRHCPALFTEVAAARLVRDYRLCATICNSVFREVGARCACGPSAVALRGRDDGEFKLQLWLNVLPIAAVLASTSSNDGVLATLSSLTIRARSA